MYIVMLLVAICALFTDTHALPKHRPRLPSNPGYGPFNPRQSWPVPLPNVSIQINIYVIFGYAEYLIFRSYRKSQNIYFSIHDNKSIHDNNNIIIKDRGR